jgi:hypothetical protein
LLLEETNLFYVVVNSVLSRQHGLMSFPQALFGCSLGL